MEKGQTLSKGLSLSKLTKSSSNVGLKSALERAKIKVNLNKSCFGAITTEKKPLDLDLTNLNWLQNNNLLKGISCTAKTACLSPPRDTDMDLSFIPGTQIQGGGNSAKNGNYKVSLSVGKSNPRKPPYSFSSLIFMAIEDSPSKKLPVKDIYNWITERFPYFQSAPLGWKNSVRHNLSLNKCFMKVDKDKGQAMGKGSLWCVDPEYRPNLLQALRKTPSFHPYSQWTTPPPSPQSSSGSTTTTPKSLESKLLQNRSGRHTPNVDPEAEAEAAATMCMMGRGSSDAKDTNSKRKRHLQTYKGSFSDLLSVAVSLEKAQKAKNKRRKESISPGSSMDSEYEFDHCSDSEDDPNDDDDAMDTLIKNDELGDSGYGDKMTNSDDKNDEDIVGADALLELASKACAMPPLSVASSEASDSS